MERVELAQPARCHGVSLSLFVVVVVAVASSCTAARAFLLCTLFGVVQFRGLALLCNLFVGGFSRGIVYIKVYIIHAHTHTDTHTCYIM